MTIIWTEK